MLVKKCPGAKRQVQKVRGRNVLDVKRPGLKSPVAKRPGPKRQGSKRPGPKYQAGKTF